MTDKQKQIEKIKDTIDSVYGCDCAYYGVEGFAIAEALYNAGYRKQDESEWEEVAIVKQGEIVKRCYECPVCSMLCDTNEPLCPACGAKMKGGAE